MRDDAELVRVAASPALDAVAMRYLDDLIAARCVCPAAGESPIADDLLDDVATALDEDTSLLDAGLVTGTQPTQVRSSGCGWRPPGSQPA
jgi:hypothetical protein